MRAWAPRGRLLGDIISDLNALTSAQKTAVWNDLTSGSPAKWELNNGFNASAIAVLKFVVSLASLSAADVVAAKIFGVAMYCQDNPVYLVHPAFDSSINVPGE